MVFRLMLSLHLRMAGPLPKLTSTGVRLSLSGAWRGCDAIYVVIRSSFRSFITSEGVRHYSFGPRLSRNAKHSAVAMLKPFLKAFRDPLVGIRFALEARDLFEMPVGPSRRNAPLVLSFGAPDLQDRDRAGRLRLAVEHAFRAGGESEIAATATYNLKRR